MLKNRGKNKKLWFGESLMNKGLGFGALVILFVAAAYNGVATAKMGDVVDSFNAPPDGCIDLAWDGKSLWSINVHIGPPYGGGYTYKFDKGGNIVDSLHIEGMSLAYDGKYFWSAKENEIYKFDKNGEIVDSFIVPYEPFSTTEGRWGMAYDGKYIWCCGQGGKGTEMSEIIKLDKDGNVLFVDYIFLKYCTGLAWDGKNLWAASIDDKRIHKLNEYGQTITSIDVPEGYYPVGLAYDGKYLWCAAVPEEVIFREALVGEKIFKIDLGEAAPSKGIPGFEAGLAITGLLAVTFLLKRRK